MHPISLATNVCGISLENPFILASAPPTACIESIHQAFSLGWAGAVLKTITSYPHILNDVSPRFSVLKANKQTIGFENIELLSRKSFEYWQTGIIALKQAFPQKIIIASIMAPTQKEAWQKLVIDLQALPIDAFELNFSCPHGMPEHGLGMAIGTNLEISAEITRWVKEKSTVPVFVKLTPNITDIASIALAVKKAGADGLTAINTVQCLIGIDLETLEPKPAVNGYSTFGGYSGRAIKPIGLRCVAQTKVASGLPILAVGGVSTWQDAVEYLAVGGDAVQVCTEVMLNGYGVIKDMLSGLSKYLADKNMNSLKAVHGIALPKLVTHAQLMGMNKSIAYINSAQCIACGKCAMICAESGYTAIKPGISSFIIDSSLCDGCGLCTAICPHHAITMQPLK